jgi:hypothetical protein
MSSPKALLSSDSKTIAGHEYVIGTLPLAKSQAVWLLLVKCLGPAIAEMMAKPGGLPRQFMAAGLREVIGRLDNEALTHIRIQFGEVSRRDGKPLDPATQELAFAGRLGEMFEWLQACVEHNYADFLAYGRNVWRSAVSTSPSSEAPEPAEGSESSPSP